MHSRTRLPLLALLVLAFGFSTMYALTARAPSATSGPVIGVNCGRWIGIDEVVSASVGAKVVRVEFNISADATTLDGVIAAYAGQGIAVQPLAGFHARIPTSQDAQNMRNWALRFGPGGTFWQGRSDGHLAIRNIEFGNETSYGYQYGDDPSSPSYQDRARTYALRAKEAAVSLQGTSVGLLVQADDALMGPTWVDQMFSAVPDLASYVTGWTVHPYGPSMGPQKLERMTSSLAAHGETSIPYYLTEWGLATDDGRALNDNYGYATNMTYAQAAATLRDTLASWRSTYGSRLAQVILYTCRDGNVSGATSEREDYFGVVQRMGEEKGQFTAEVRSQIATGGAAPPPPPSNDDPVAAATATPTSGPVPLTVSFTGSGSRDFDGSITSYAWDLDGDGAFDDSSLQNPTRVYVTAGTYTVRLRVTDNQGAQDVSDAVTVTAQAAGTPSPSPSPSPSGLVEKARGKPASASTSEAASWFEPRLANDGDTSTRWSSTYADNQWWQVDLGSSQAVDSVHATWHQWAWPKTYSVSLSNDGSSWTTVASGSLSTWGMTQSSFALRNARYVRVTGLERATSAGISLQEVKVFGPSQTTPPPPPPPPPSNVPPVATATATPTSGTIPLTVAFDGSASKDTDGSIASYAWDLDGDGAFDDSTAQKPSYEYTGVGTYSVKLKVTDNQGAQAVSAPLTIVAGPRPAPPPPSPGDRVDLYLVDVGPNEKHVIRILRSATDLTNEELRALVARAPVMIVEDMRRDLAEKVKEALTEVGATVELR